MNKITAFHKTLERRNNMNKVQYKLVKSFYKRKTIQKKHLQQENLETYIEEQYQHLNEISQKEINETLKITYNQFRLLITAIYKVLKQRITIETFYKVADDYLSLLIADCILENIQIDLNYCLEKLDYLALYQDKKITGTYIEDIPLIEQKLERNIRTRHKYKNKILKR